MIFLELFITFLEIGAVSFGGGYGMISLMREKVLSHGWMSEESLLNLIALSESTPGPIAVNMATFVGSSQGGVLGALLATLGVVLPSFIVILIISALVSNLLKYGAVKAILSGVRPTVVGLIVATALTMLFGNLLGLRNIGDSPSPDLAGILIFAALVLLTLIWKRFKKKKPSPIVMILISAGLGMAVYPFLG